MKVLTRAYTNSHVKTAKRLLQDLARRLDTDYPSAATNVREGLDETLTVLGVGSVGASPPIARESSPFLVETLHGS